MKKIDTILKDKQMLLAKKLPAETCKDVLLTLIYKSDTSLVQRVLIERGAIKDIIQFNKEVLNVHN